MNTPLLPELELPLEYISARESKDTNRESQSHCPSVEPLDNAVVAVLQMAMPDLDLWGLRKDYRRQPDESIISWLVRLWDAAGEATILDGTEARHLGSLSHDPVIDQEMMREASPCSLWIRVLGSVAERYLCADDLYMQQTPWKTIEQGIQRLREMAVAEMVFSDDINTRNPDLVSCTSVMWRKLIRLGPLEYASALAVMKREDMEETVLDMAKKLRAYADAVHGPTHARIAAVETCLQKLEDKIDENHKKLREEIREDLLHISAVQIRGSGTQRRHSPVWEIRDRRSEDIALYGQTEPLPQLLVDVSLTGKEWEKHPIVTGPEAPCILGIDYLRSGYFKDPKGLSPIWPVRKSEGEWRLTVDYRALNEVTPPLSAAVPDMLELQYELESKAAKWYATIDIANAFFSIPLAAECRPQFAFTWRGVQYTWNRLPQGWKHSPTICHGLIQTAQEKGEAPEHLQYIDDIIVWGNTAAEVFEKGKKIIQILLEPVSLSRRVKLRHQLMRSSSWE
ncbi:hypothetical protein DUI87_13523 [Hirundo rustica rustica]|uniref:ribonuclease H n=1 Tax=Hirundo rustica rustica TaxID=333673 RepID=A0A3M0K956_HIRRU|nr:hypothetical protein DUI87_13523 [Hirundo rustica rustica]